jgi:antitoxin PrlF
MIQSKITSKAQTTVPRAVRTALRLGAGDALAWEIDGDRVTVSLVRAEPADFSAFSEWADPLDSVYDDL